MNPSNSSVDSGRQSGTAPVNVVDNPRFVNHQGLNQFDLSQQFLFTARYGEITPFFNMECVGRDRVRLRNSYDLRSYTLSSPLLSSLRMKKSYFQVPLSSILPNVWQYLFTNPLKGNDIPDDAQCRLNLSVLVSSMGHSPESFGTLEPNYEMEFILKCYCLLSCIFSSGGLFYLLGFKNDFGFDDFLEKNLFDQSTVTLLKGSGLTLVSPYDYTTITVNDMPSLRRLFYTLMEYPDSEIQCSISRESLISLYQPIGNFIQHLPSLPDNVNISKVIAYQFLYSQFFTNDKIDNVYNSELFLSNQKSLGLEIISFAVPSFNRFFILNGTSVEYDVYSGHFMKALIDSMVGTDFSEFNKFLDFWLNTFSLRRSLRYGDYFTGARTQPLAVGDTVVNVANSGVSVVDINKSIHIQRFLNACNRVGSNLINYTRGIFGYEPPKDYHQPAFIASETDFIGGQEVENTSANDQGNVVTNLRSSSSKFEFDVFIDNPCYIIGVVSFECTPAYSSTVNRDFYHFNRFDYFNPMLQNVGDQPIYMNEFKNGSQSDLIFGYQSRYAEYKHRYSECSGGFVFNLPSWAFTKSDDARSINEYLIRSRPDEFDRFYKSLAYGSPAGYYHFILSFVNNVDALRPMEVTPSLL